MIYDEEYRIESTNNLRGTLRKPIDAIPKYEYLFHKRIDENVKYNIDFNAN